MKKDLPIDAPKSESATVMRTTTAKTETKNNDKALAAFMAATGNAAYLAEKIAEHIADHFDADPESVNWGHVGTANHVAEQLAQIAAHLGIASR